MNKIVLYLQHKKVLILDKSSTTRQLIERSLIQLGADKTLITSMKSFDHAVDFVKSHQPDIIITDFQIHDKYGLDLVELQNQYIRNPFERIFVVVTENSNDSSVADAAEEEVDSYLLKPFSSDVFRDYMMRVIANKLSPNEYSLLLLKGKTLFEQEKLDAAKSEFDLAFTKSNKPTLALYYLAKIAQLQGDLSKALELYKDGLKYSPLHFKCLVGEFIVLNELQHIDQAYNAIKTIAKTYPLSPQLLKHAFILCITTFKYKDVEIYFDMYMKLGRKPDDLKSVVSHALLTSGKLLLNDGFKEEAISYFLKGAIINGRGAKYLNSVIDSLLSKSLVQEAESYIGMFEAEEVGGSIYKQLLFKINTHKLPYDKVIEEGKNLINEGSASPDIYLKVFSLLKNTPHKALLENLIYKAIDQFPNLKKDFLTYFPS